MAELLDWDCFNDMIKASCEVSDKIKVMKADALLAELENKPTAAFGRH